MISLRGLGVDASLTDAQLDAIVAYQTQFPPDQVPTTNGAINGVPLVNTYDPYAPPGSATNPFSTQVVQQTEPSSSISDWLSKNSTTLVALSALVGVLAFVTGRRR